MSSIPGTGGDTKDLQDDVRSTLANTSFRRLLWASGTSSMGDWIGFFALIALAETLEGATRAGALAVSLVMAARIVPTLLIAPVAGVFVDRWDRKRTMLMTDLARGTLMLLVAFVGDTFQLVIATLAIESASALFMPAKDSVVPTVVKREQLVTANQLSLASTYGTLPLGALACAGAIALTSSLAADGTFLAGRPEVVPIILNALTFFVSMVFVQRMDVPTDNVRRHRTQEQSSVLSELREGLHFVATKPLIRALIVGVMTAFFAAGVVIGIGKFFATVINAGEEGFALLGFAVGVGLMAGIGLARWIDQRISKERLFAPGIALSGLSLVAAALMPTLTLAALPVFLMGLGAGVPFVTGYALLHELSTDDIRGRIFATFNTAVRLSLFAATVLAPLTLSVLGVERTEEQIARGEQGAQVELGAEGAQTDEIQLDEDAVYPYQIGGVRVTLVVSGALAVIGAVWSGSQIAGALRRRGDGEDRDGLLAGAERGSFATALPDHAGAFIVFEGGDGAGKSTQVRLLAEAVQRAGYRCHVTREPGGTPLGEEVRGLVLDPRWRVEPRTEALLYAAARAQHVEEVLRPALEDGHIVISDRFIDSSVVYQGHGRDLGTEVIASLNGWATAGLHPDLVVVLDVDASTGLGRVAESGTTADRLESAGDDFHTAVNEAFVRRAEEDPDRYLVIDARRSVDEIQRRVRDRVRELLDGAGGPVRSSLSDASTSRDGPDEQPDRGLATQDQADATVGDQQ